MISVEALNEPIRNQANDEMTIIGRSVTSQKYSEDDNEKQVGWKWNGLRT